MLKKCLSILLCFFVVMTAFVGFSQAAYAADGVYNKLISLKSRFPDGKYWNHQVTNGYNNGDQIMANGDESYSDTVTSTPCATHSGTAAIWQYDCNYFDGGMQCWGFACKIFYETFGERASSLPKRTDKSNISVGDYLRFGSDSNGHSAVVLSRNGDSITVVECNNTSYGGICNIHWGGTSNINNVSYFKHSTKWESVNGSYNPEPSATFNDWWNDNYTFITSTNAAIGQEITTSGGSFTRVGMILFDANGNRLGVGSDTPVDGLKRYFYNINTELGCTLNPDTTYKYQFFADVGGKTLYGPVKLFTTSSIIFEEWWNDEFTYVGTTDASIGKNIIAYGDNYTDNGMILYNSVGEQVASVSQRSTAGYTHYYFKINEELHYTLTPGTVYKYRFFAVVNGKTYYSELQSFTTLTEDKVEISWTDNLSLPSKHNAYVSVKSTAPNSGTFSSAALRVWDYTGTLIASKNEQFSYTKNNVFLYYDIYKDTEVLLKQSAKYTYQISVGFNGYTYDSPTYSFTTESDDDNRFGIDVSAHQGYIDWETAADYIDFAIIRCGYGSDYTQNDDTCWEYNVSECERLGIPYGVYLYSYAENDGEASSEADHVLRLLSGHYPELPVYYDLEDSNTTGKLSNEQIRKQAVVFCEKVKAAGYDVGVYANLNWWSNKLSSSSYDSYHKWYAAYGNFDLTGRELWQYSSSGSVPGINGNVDLDYSRESVLANRALVGDVNSDGKVDNRDAMILDRYAAGWPGYYKYIKNMDAADLSGDGVINNRDAMILDRYVAGWDGYGKYIKRVKA